MLIFIVLVTFCIMLYYLLICIEPDPRCWGMHEYIKTIVKESLGGSAKINFGQFASILKRINPSRQESEAMAIFRKLATIDVDTFLEAPPAT